MFKFLIEGKSIAELKENIVEFFNEFEALQPSAEPRREQEDFLTSAAKLPDVPRVEASPREVIPSAAIPALTSPSAPSVVPPTTSTATTQKVSGTATSAPIANDYGVDSRGLPWDERIHSVTQAKVKDGSWRYKRGVEDSTIKLVEAELATKARGMQEAQMVPQPVPVVQPAPVAAPFVSPPSLQVVPQPVAVVAPPMPAPQPAVPSAHSLKTFKETLIPTLAKLVKDGKLTQDYINQLCSHYGVDMIHKVNDQQLAEMFEGFVQYGMVVKAE